MPTTILYDEYTITVNAAAQRSGQKGRCCKA